MGFALTAPLNTRGNSRSIRRKGRYSMGQIDLLQRVMVIGHLRILNIP